MIRDKIEECELYINPQKTPDYTEAEVQALRAVYDGKGTERQQRVFCEWLMRVCGKDDEMLRAGSPDLTAFACGKRFIATTFVWMLKSAPTRTDPDKIAARTVEDDPDGRTDNR